MKAVINGRFHVMAQFAREVMHHVHREELKKLDRRDREKWTLVKRAKRLMVRETTLLDEVSRQWLQQALAHNAALHTVYAMKQRLADIWQRSATTQEHLRHALEEWCHQAEATGIQALHQFALKLRSYRLASTAS